VNVTSELSNDNWFDLTTEDFNLKLYDNTTNTLLDTTTMLSTHIQGVPRSTTRSIILQFNVPQDTLINVSQDPRGRRKVEALITADTKIGLAGVNEEIPVIGKTVYVITPFVP
jgi:hypothetical protein